MGAYATGSPLFPSGYVAGTITVAAANTPYNLLALVQAQLDPNCPGAGYEVTLQTDISGPLYVGQQNLIGPLSSANYGYCLDKSEVAGYVSGASRTYRSGFPGSHSSIGDINVLMTVAGGTFHVELT